MQARIVLCSDTTHPSVEDIARVTRELYGIDAIVAPLPGYEDLNYRLTNGSSQMVLKVATAGTPAQVLDLQYAAMEWLRPRFAGQIQRVIPTIAGSHLSEVHSPDGARLVRMLSFIPGKRMVDVATGSPGLLRSLGGFLGRIDRRLLSFEHPCGTRSLEWSLSETSQLRRWLSAVDGAHQQALIIAVLDRFDNVVAPLLPSLRDCIIHNDANGHNILVEDGPTPTRIVGLIDFGDIVRAPLICDMAIAIAYAILDTEEPLEVAELMTGAFHQELPLTREEVDVLYDLVRSRLAMSVTLCARDLRARPENTYLTVSLAPALRTLERLATLDPERAQVSLRRACGYA